MTHTGLALALVVSLDSTMDPAFSHAVLFHTAGVVMLTLLVNARCGGWGEREKVCLCLFV